MKIGKVSGDARVGIKTSSKVLSKKDKKAMQQQMSRNKKMAVLDRKRFGTLEGAPKTVVIIIFICFVLYFFFRFIS